MNPPPIPLNLGHPECYYDEQGNNVPQKVKLTIFLFSFMLFHIINYTKFSFEF